MTSDIVGEQAMSRKTAARSGRVDRGAASNVRARLCKLIKSTGPIDVRLSFKDRDRGEPRSSAHRVTGGGRPPPVPTERSVRIYRTTLFGRCFTALFAAIRPSFVSMVS
jgi:hypothetical protein